MAEDIDIHDVLGPSDGLMMVDGRNMDSGK